MSARSSATRVRACCSSGSPRSLKTKEIAKTTDEHAGEQNHGLERDLRRAARHHEWRRTEASARVVYATYNSSVKHDNASNPLTERYASREMSYLFSPNFKFRTWRRLWIALAEAEQELGLPITDAQIAELKANAETINFEDAERREREVRHDVMAHVHAYGLQATSAKGHHPPRRDVGVRHGQHRDPADGGGAAHPARAAIVNLMAKLRDFAWQWRATPALAFTHFQPAQLTTVGKRATLWLHDLLLDYREIEFRESQLALLGVKGATGTQASFLNLFDGDEAKVHRLEQLVAEKIGMRRSYPVSGQTYSRKVDAQVVSALSGFAQSASKFGYDMRLLQHLREIEEPFEEEQIGSSAMPYKRNPMRAERIDALARHLIVNALNPAFTAATQWFERTLDDSANRRIAIPEAFLAADAIALIYDNIVGGIVVHEDVIAANVRRELPFLMTENLMMEGAARGGDRQVLHERIRIHAQAARGRAEGRRGAERSVRPHRRRSAVRHRPRIHRAHGAAGRLHRALAAADGAIPHRGRRSDSRDAEREQIRDEVRTRCAYESARSDRLAGAALASRSCATAARRPRRRRRSAPEVLHGVASWYGEEFAGRTTANGEIFDPAQLTAAHRTLPFGTVARHHEPEDAADRARARERPRAVHRRARSSISRTPRRSRSA